MLIRGKNSRLNSTPKFVPYWTADARGAFHRPALQKQSLPDMCGRLRVQETLASAWRCLKRSLMTNRLPRQIAERVTGLSFNAYGYTDNSLNVRVLDVSGNILTEQVFPLEAMKIKTFSLNFESTHAKEVVFFLHSKRSARLHNIRAG
jgi:hypothetical protein